MPFEKIGPGIGVVLRFRPEPSFDQHVLHCLARHRVVEPPQSLNYFGVSPAGLFPDADDGRAQAFLDARPTVKSGSHTVGVKRQYNSNRGKIENAVVSVAASL